MGVGAVAGHLLAEEVEHYRCGIGMILENSGGEVRVGGLIKGGTGFNSDLEQGDEILSINDRAINHKMRIEEVAGFIRGKEGSVVSITIRKRSGMVATVRLVRARLPGGRTEMLGALWQSPTSKGLKERLTVEEKLDVLAQLRSRGNLSENEYEMAKRRLTSPGGCRGPGNGADDSDRSLPGNENGHWYHENLSSQSLGGTPSLVSTPPPELLGVKGALGWRVQQPQCFDEPPSPQQKSHFHPPAKRDLSLGFSPEFSPRYVL